jgi:hypothetical protein
MRINYKLTLIHIYKEIHRYMYTQIKTYIDKYTYTYLEYIQI